MSARRVVLTTDNTAEPGHDGEMEREAQNNDEEGSGPCSICSTSRHPIHHRHYSSRFLRKIAGIEYTDDYHLCPSCKSIHIPYPEPRLKVVVSDSTLHQFFAPPGHTADLQYSGDIIHIDYLTISGADIRTLAFAFKREYIDIPPGRPMDVVLVAGYTDLINDVDRELMMLNYRVFADIVGGSERRASDYDPNVTNSVVITTLMYPPRVAWLSDDGDFPYDGYINHKEKIDWLNGQIQALNATYHASYPPCLHTFGVRTGKKTLIGKGGEMVTLQTKSHRWQHWRESSPGDMLHLTTERIFKVGASLNNYFLFNT